MSSGIFLLFSIGILGGIVSAALLKKARAPQVLGYILTGLIIGQSGLRFVTLADIEKLQTFNIFALALIGLLVGSEIKIADMRRYGKQFSSILFGEGFGAFILVGILTGGVLYKVTGNFPIALAGGLIFGAISSATDPASTMSVLWEKRSAGILTTTIIAVIALDDALAMLLYGISSGVAQIIASGSGTSLTGELVKIAIEIPGSAAAGGLIGYLTSVIMKKFRQSENIVTVSFGLFLLAIALSVISGLDVIIMAMVAGLVIANMVPHQSKPFFKYMMGIANPVYVLFFVLTGARLTLGSMPGWLWLIVGLFVVGRSLGKVTGAYLGARISGAGQVVKRLTGLGLFSQGGVAIGLSIMAGHHLQGIALTDNISLGDAIIGAVTTTTFLIQLIGPAAVSRAVKLSGEAGLNMTLDDFIKEQKVKDVLNLSPLVVIKEHTTIAETIDIFSSADGEVMPVVDEENNFIGLVTFENLRQILAEHSFWSWSLVTDIMDFHVPTITSESSLDSAFLLVESLSYKKIPVVDDEKLISMLDAGEVRGHLQNELIKKQEAAYAE